MTEKERVLNLVLLTKFILVDEGVFPNKVYSLAVYVNITTHS